jgi:hypothetical protein
MQFSRGEGAAAAAGPRRLRVLENEALADQRLLEIEGGVREIEKTLRIDEDAGAIFLDDFVAIAGLSFEAHGVGKTRAASALDADAESTGVRGDAFLGEQFADFLRRFFGYVNHLKAVVSDPSIAPATARNLRASK